MKLSKRDVIFLSILVIIGLIPFLFDYSSIAHVLNHPYFTKRGINTPSRFFYYGYLGLFFRYRYFGFGALTLIATLIYLYKSKKNLPEYLKHTLILFFISYFAVTLYAPYNYRYAYTFYPLTILLLLLTTSCTNIKKVILALIFSTVFILSLIAPRNPYKQYFYYGLNNNTSLLSTYNYQILVNKLKLHDKKVLTCSVKNRDLFLGFFYRTGIKSLNCKDLPSKKLKIREYYKQLKRQKIKYIIINANDLKKPSSLIRLNQTLEQHALVIYYRMRIVIYLLL